MDGIISTNHRGEIIFFNPAAERIFGFRQPEALGRPLTCVMPERYWDAYHRGLRRFLSEGGTRIIGRAVEVTGRRKDGAEFPLELSIASWRIGSDVCFTAIARDISERKAAERGLQALSGRLLQLRDEEQRRIARELHDSTAQKVSALALNLAILEQASDVLGPKQLRALADSCGLADECSRELRDLAALLHPPQLDMVGLASAIRWHSESFARATGIRVTLALSPRLGRMPQDIETTIFRIVQECLNNIRRHAQSPTAAILIDVDDRDVTVEVKDEGRGMPENYDGAAPGVGIHAMRGRVRQHGGRFDITSGTAGTRVHVSLPLSRTEAGEAAVSRNA